MDAKCIGGVGELVPKHSEHERIFKASLVQSWKSGKRSIWPQSQYEALFGIFIKYALPNLGAQAWVRAFLGLGQSWELSRLRTPVTPHAPAI
eukprot:517877-Pelagomonas_calceolata.AAC.2